MDTVSIPGKMEEFMMEIGRTIKCKEKEYLLGQMVENMKGTMLMIRNKDMEYLLLEMEEFIKENGKMESSMEKDTIKKEV